jgi:hypothetical protein
MTPADFEARTAAPPASQHPLFDTGRREAAAPDPDGLRERTRDHVAARLAKSPERAALAAALRQLLATGDGESVPADAVAALLRELEG